MLKSIYIVHTIFYFWQKTSLSFAEGRSRVRVSVYEKFEEVRIPKSILQVAVGMELSLRTGVLVCSTYLLLDVIEYY
jgi:hypothetical protein